MPAAEGFDGFVFGGAEVIVGAGGLAIALSVEEVGEGVGLEFLNGLHFLSELVGAEGHGHFDFVGGVFGLVAAVEPDAAVFDPGLIEASFPGGFEGHEGDALDAAGVGEVSGEVDLVRAEGGEDGADEGDVGGAEVELAVAAFGVEGEVEEADVGWFDAEADGGVAGFSAADEGFEAAEASWGVAEGAFGVDFFEDAAGVVDLFFPAEGVLFGGFEEDAGEADGFGVGDAEVASGEVADVDVVALADEAFHGAAHAEDVVLGFWGEDEDGFGEGGGALGAGGVVGVGFAAGPAGDGLLLAVKDFDIEVIGFAVAGEQFGHAVFVVFAVAEFEDGFVFGEGEPEDGAAGFGGGPGGAADEPGQANAGEGGGGGAVEEAAGVGVALEEAGGDGFGFGAFDGAGGDVGFVATPGHDDEAAGLEDGADAHGDGEAGDVCFAEEVGGGVKAGDAVEGDEASDGIAGAAGFVEADVAGAADAEDLEIDAAGVADGVFVGGAVVEDFVEGDGAVGEVDVVGLEVDVGEELLLHEAEVAFAVVAVEAVVFVEVESDDVGEAEVFFAVEADEFAVKGNGGGAGGEAEDGGAAVGAAF